MAEDVLDVKDLRVYFDAPEGIIKAVDGVDLNVKRGEMVGLVGESGSGKTMTGLSTMCLVPPPGQIVSGFIDVDGVKVLDLDESEMRRVRAERVAMIFQDPMTFLNPVLKVGDQIAEALIYHENAKKADAMNRVIEVLDEVRIPEPKKVVKAYPHELSGGMRQRAMIAMAIICNPRLLIADEPTTALDATVQKSVLNLLRYLKKERDMSILLITHDLGIVAETCDRVYVMYAGKIVESGDIYDTYEKPAHPYTESLLRSVLSIDEMQKQLVTIEGTVPSALDPPSGCRFHPRCRFAMAICAREEPPRVKVGNSWSSCWLRQ